ncbi:MAG: LacI family DNA-binding transcriptional regulator [Gemmatimonas sp.]|uniref:LacI family DNA-binding transcriptional regulator n=1 Tax=Gemmatimonas sp. TaxID=1962908 RepID=UPI00333F6534|nr:LacI family transcriptional regulator [Gemmatimonadota bacterium]
MAKAAGVSIATVSRVLNDAARVTDETRDRVRSVVDRMGYAPHGGARSLITRRTRTLGVLLPELYGEFFSEFIRGIDETAKKHGFLTLITSARREAHEISAAVSNMRGRVDGFLAVSPSVAARATLAEVADRYPTVLVGAGSDVGAFAALSVNNFQGAATMMKHLLSLGHRRIVFLRGPTGQVDAGERLHAVREVANWYDDCELRELQGEFRMDTAYDAVSALLQGGDRPDAIFAANDTMAIGAIAAVRDADLRVPDDIAVTGFDDTPVTRFLSPPLTTVRMPIFALGERAAMRLIETMRSGGTAVPAHHEVLPAQLVIRSSCGAAQRMIAEAAAGD